MGSRVALSQTFRPFFEPSLGRMVVGSNVDNPEKLAATDRHMPVRSAGFGKAKNRIILASTDDRGAITDLQAWPLLLATNHGLALSPPLSTFKPINVLLQVFEPLLQLLLAGVLIHLLAAAVHHLGVGQSPGFTGSAISSAPPELLLQLIELQVQEPLMQGGQCQAPAHTLRCACADRLAIRSIQPGVEEVVDMCLLLFIHLA